MTNVLVVGGGGREHALVWGLSRWKGAGTIHCAPGNPGMAPLAELHPGLQPTAEDLLPLIKGHKVGLVVIGPEAPLAAGLADDLRAHGVMVFGPGKAGAMLESSKVYAKKFMDRHGIPTASWDLCRTLDEAEAALARRTPPYIVKADGLAAGKGVLVAQDLEEALRGAREMIEGGIFGDSGRQVIVEDALIGEEITILALTDGKTFRMLPPSQDHKRVFDDDRGPNTGGMGAYAPVPWAGPVLLEKIRDKILTPTLAGLAEEGISYCGVIYAGLMIDEKDDPRVVEYNVRFGDPEAQAVIPLLGENFGETLLACCEERLDQVPWQAPDRWAADVILASGGYPGPFEKGLEITGLEKAAEMEDFLVFHGGTALDGQGRLITSGGRVLSAVGLGDSLEEAIEKAYDGVALINFSKKHFRRDIGGKAFARGRNQR